MIHLYPANRIENLVLLLDQVLKLSSEDPLASEIVVVQNPGMRHWLSMRLAEQDGICMNLEFMLPAAFFWRQINHLAHGEQRPPASLYSREVMAWRLDALLASEETRAQARCEPLTRYWRREGREDAARRFQLASQIADLFEQYLIYRPDWIREWDQAPDAPSDEDGPRAWQAWLWKRLVAEQPQHPLRLYAQALNGLEGGERRPSRACFFGINALPPLWLEFLGRLGEHSPIHLFHLNPCVEYWGDLRSEKQLARQFARWADDSQWNDETGNPLLASLGAQGREFLSLLQDHTDTEIPVFEPPAGLDDDTTRPTLLQRLQTDILELRDGRDQPETLIDDSLTLVSAHNALREVQGLHDWLLHRFDEDPTLTPRDIVVMCPAIERYAPYIEAVFTHGGSDADTDTPRLPCSIADRVLLDAEPLIAAFSSLLDLPDSRFRISEILAWLRLPAVRARFDLNDGDLERLTPWLRNAGIHWGLDAAHKRHTLHLEQDSTRFTWRQGLERLLLGFAHGDRGALYQEELLLPDVEGDDALLLGRLIQILDTLRRHMQELRRPRSASAWRRYLNSLRDELFSELPEDREAHQLLTQVIDTFSEATQLAGYREAIPLAVVRDHLRGCFAQPEPGRRFLTGQITFCSMIPMRSIPFRIIAVLGLNDGEYPRHRPPLGFDLMADTPRAGDRSRRGDDRYLFLEVLISARERLYLSYQGNDIKTNQPRQPSLILQELMDYLAAAHGWNFEGDASLIRRLPLQPFSNAAFDPAHPAPRSFDAGWARLATPGAPPTRRIALPEPEPSGEASELEQIIKALDHPARAFARQRLGLYLDAGAGAAPRDSEPFATDTLLRYRIQQEWIALRLQHDDADPRLETLRRALRLDGRLPDIPTLEEELENWTTQADAFADLIRAQGGHRLQARREILELDGLALRAALPFDDQGRLLFQRLADPKGSDRLSLWLHHLHANCLHPEGIVTQGFYRSRKASARRLHLPPLPASEARDQLTDLLRLWRELLCEPLLLHAGLGAAWLDGKLDPPRLERLWRGDGHRPGLGDDPYIRWFWPQAPTLDELPVTAYQRLYAPIEAHLTESEI